MEFELFRLDDYIFEYKAYSGVVICWNNYQQFSGHSGIAPYCFNRLSKKEAQFFVDFIQEKIENEDLSRNKLDILFKCLSECLKVIERPKPKIIW